MTRIWLVNWHFQSRITLWCRQKSTNVCMGLCWQMPKFIVWRLWSIYFDHHLPLKPSIGKRRKQSCTPNIYNLFLLIFIKFKLFNCNSRFIRVASFNMLQYVLTIVLTSTNSLECDANKFSKFCEEFWQSEKRMKRERNLDDNHGNNRNVFQQHT